MDVGRKTGTASVLDPSSTAFDPDAYLASLLKSKSLEELVREEEGMLHSVRRLEAEMQQLVYENYNKFLTATGTIRGIEQECHALETEMSSLSQSMSSISNLLTGLSSSFSVNRQSVGRVGRTHRAVAALKTLVQLPQTLQSLCEDRKFRAACETYDSARPLLDKFADMPSVARITEEANAQREEIRTRLVQQLQAVTIEPDGAREAVELLLRMGECEQVLAEQLLSSVCSALRLQLTELEQQSVSDSLELVDAACAGLLTNVAMSLSSFASLFPSCQTERHKLETRLTGIMTDWRNLLATRIISSKTSDSDKDCSLVVRALDRHCRKSSICSQLLTVVPTWEREDYALTLEVARSQLSTTLTRLSAHFERLLQEVRADLATANRTVDSRRLVAATEKLEHAVLMHSKAALAGLLPFAASDVSWSGASAEFTTPFRRLLLDDLLSSAVGKLESDASSLVNLTHVSAHVPLIVAVMAQRVSRAAIPELSALVQHQFGVSDKDARETGATLSTQLASVCAPLLRRFAEQRGLELSVGLQASFESKDWRAPIEVSGVRAAVRCLTDELVVCDAQLGGLFEDIGASGTSSVSTTIPTGWRRAASTASASGWDTRGGSAPPTGAASSELTALDRLWAEKVDFSAPIQMNRSSVLTAVCRFPLKVMVECARTLVFSRHGVQQLQIDCAWIRRQLLESSTNSGGVVVDDTPLNALLDEALASALRRCADQTTASNGVTNNILIHPTRLAEIVNS